MALLLLPWLVSILGPAAGAAEGPAGSARFAHRSIAQASMPAAVVIPAEVLRWFDAMKAAADEENGAEALRLHQRVLGWVRVHLPEKHVFRARVMVRYGYVLARQGHHQAALIPGRAGAQMLRELVKSEPYPETSVYLTVALYQLAFRHANLDQPQAALAVYQELLPRLRKLARTRAESRETLAFTLRERSKVFTELGRQEEAKVSLEEAVLLLRDLATTSSGLEQNLTIWQIDLAGLYTKLGLYDQARSAYLQALPSLREQAKTSDARRYKLSETLVALSDIYGKLDQPSEILPIFREVLPLLRRELSDLREQIKNNAESRDSLIPVLFRIGIIYSELGQFRHALTAFQEVLPLVRDLAKKNTVYNNQLISLLELVLSVYVKLGEEQKGLPYAEERLQVLRQHAKSNGEHRETFKDLLVKIGRLHALSGQSLEHNAYHQEAIALLERDLPGLRQQALANPLAMEKLARNLDLYSDSLRGLNQQELALVPIQESVQIHRKLASSNPARIDHLVQALDRLATALSELGQWQPALAARQEAVRLVRALQTSLPSKKELLANALIQLSKQYRLQGLPQQSLAVTEEAVLIYRELATTNPSSRSMLATVLAIDLYQSYADLNLTQAALNAAQESVRMFRALQSVEPVERLLMAALVKQGMSYAELGQWQQALVSFQELVEVSDQKQSELFDGRWMHGVNLSFLALPYRMLGRGQEALAVTQEAIKVRGDGVPSSSNAKLLYSAMQASLSTQYALLGQYEEALPPAMEAVRVARTLAKSTPAHSKFLADCLVNLAAVNSKLQRHRDVLLVTQEANQIYQQLSASQPNLVLRSDVGNGLLLMGLAQHELGQTTEALERTRQAIQRLRVSDAQSEFRRIDLAGALHQQARFLAEAGLPQQAAVPAREAVTLMRGLARQAPGLLDRLSESTTTLAVLSLQRGRSTAALPLLKEAVSAEVRFLQQQLPLMPEGRRQVLVDTLGRRWEIPFSLAQQGDAGASLALYARLNRHGPLQDIERRQSIVSRSSEPTQRLVNRLSILNSQLSTSTLSAQGRQNALAESERLQEELHRQLPALQPRLVEIAEVARRLPADGVLVEFQRFSPYNAAKPDKEAWGKPRYLALLLERRGTPRAVDLGDADALDQAIATALDRTRFQQPNADRAWAFVAEKVFSPLRGAWQGKRQLLVSPDGQLHRVPFSALALLAGDTLSLPADLTLHTIGSGRDLVTAATAQPSPASAPLVLANPTTKGWAPLVRAASEGQRVASALGTQPLLGPAASVAAVERSRGPRILHVAGHGYFDPQAKGDPLLASGLALAGADKARQPSRPSSPASSLPTPSRSTDDGYLTAKEAARLQLEGTDLVVLSSCESGLGSERSGEGLFGLQRALTVAGARGTLLSLWKVPEHATETFMTRFYALLGQGVPPAEAVRRVQAEFRDRPPIDGWSDPFYWAGWQYSGLPDPAR